MNFTDGMLDRIKNHSIKHTGSKKPPIRKSAPAMAEQRNKLDTGEVNQDPNLYLEKSALQPGHIIRAGEQEIKIDRKTIMVFSDDEPLLNWSHKCRYLLYDAKTEQLYKEVNAQFPPTLVDPPKTFIPFHKPTVHTEENKNMPGGGNQGNSQQDDVNIGSDYIFSDYNPRFPNYLGKRYALLYSGCTNRPHLNDLESLYRILINSYGFKPENIYILNYNGSKNYSDFYYEEHRYYPGVGDRVMYLSVNGAGTRSDLDSAIDELRGRLKEDDLLFIHTTNHGAGPGPKSSEAESSLCLYMPNGRVSRYYAEDFANKLAELPKFSELLIMMEQCHSGGFCEPILRKSPAYQTSVTAACRKEETSKSGFTFNPFANAWINLMKERTYIPAKDDKPLSASDVFSKARIYKGKEQPVIMDYPKGSSSRMFLGYKS